ncbi:MAG: MBL fold metallo-hydrolase [Phycisphaerales bacterium]
MRIRVLGAAGEVTGSCYLVETSKARVLVEFGLYQGGAHTEAKNRRLPPIDPATLDAVVLTHAHLDHSGRLPMLPRAGFKAPIHATAATIELCDILLRDSAYLQEMEAARTSKRRIRRGRNPVQPLYTTSDVDQLMPRFVRADFDTPKEVAPGVVARWVEAGHILGAASVQLDLEDKGARKTVVFSGDIGPKHAPLLRDPKTFQRADVTILESTYGDRDHPPLDKSVEKLAEIIRSARTPKGKVLIPSFAVGRTQQLIYFIGRLREDGRLQDPRVYVDSPMATSATTLYKSHRELFDDESWAIIDQGDSCLDFPGLRFTKDASESIALNPLGDGVVIISAAGMCTGGRILHHLKHNLWREETHVVFVGYQGQGTLGRRLVEGAKSVSVMGEPIRVRAQVHTLNGFSAHAGQTELVEWLATMRDSGPRVYLTHGEDPQRHALAAKIDEKLMLKAKLPAWGESIEL